MAVTNAVTGAVSASTAEITGAVASADAAAAQRHEGTVRTMNAFRDAIAADAEQQVVTNNAMAALAARQGATNDALAALAARQGATNAALGAIDDAMTALQTPMAALQAQQVSMTSVVEAGMTAVHGSLTELSQQPGQAQQAQQALLFQRKASRALSSTQASSRRLPCRLPQRTARPARRRWVKCPRPQPIRHARASTHARSARPMSMRCCEHREAIVECALRDRLPSVSERAD